MASPLRGVPAVLASTSDYCLVCEGARRMRLVALAEPRTNRSGGVYGCPHCKPGGAPALPIPLLTWRHETPRSAA